MTNISELLINMKLKSLHPSYENFRNFEIVAFSKFKNPTEKNIYGLISLNFDYEYDFFGIKTCGSTETFLINKDMISLLDDIQNEINDDFIALNCKLGNNRANDITSEEYNDVYFKKSILNWRERYLLDITIIDGQSFFTLQSPISNSLLFDPSYDLSALFKVFENIGLSPSLLEAYNRNLLSKELYANLQKQFDEDWITSQRLLYEVGDNKIIVN